MKHIIYGVALIALTVMVIAGVMIISGKNIRENEMDKALNTAVEQSLEQLKKYGSYEIGNERELIADFHQALLVHISSDADIRVKILTADIERGVLDVEVTETYQTINAREKQAVCRKTVILEEYVEKKNYYMVEFQVDGLMYEKYSLYQGGVIVVPDKPQKSGYLFKGWKNVASNQWLSDNQTADKDMMFAAVFE